MSKVLPFRRPEPKVQVEDDGPQEFRLCPGCGCELSQYHRICNTCARMPAALYGRPEPKPA